MEKTNNDRKAKPLKLRKNDIICSSCNAVLTLTEDLLDEEIIHCSKCGHATYNSTLFSEKNVICFNCGNNSPLHKSIENELNIICTDCGTELINPHSTDYNPVQCPSCNSELHIDKTLEKARFISCTICGHTFKNPKRNVTTSVPKNEPIEKKPSKKSNETEISQEIPIKITKTQRNWIVASVIVFIVTIIGIVSQNSENTTTSKYTINTDTYASYSKEIFDDLFQNIMDNDIKAVERLEYVGFIKLLPKGTNVYIKKSHLSYCIVRVEGSFDDLYVVSDHLTKQ